MGLRGLKLVLTCWSHSRKNKYINTVLSVQMNNVTPEYCLDIIQKFEVSEENKEQNVLGIEGNAFISKLFLCPDQL